MKNKVPDEKLIQNHVYTIKAQQKEVVVTKYFEHQFHVKSNVL